MTSGELVLVLVLLAAAFVMALAVLWTFGRLDSSVRRPRAALFGGRPETAFLFDDQTLVDATPQARELLTATTRDGTAWARLVRVLAPKFPTIAEDMSRLADEGEVTGDSPDGRLRLRATWQGGLARLTLVDVERDDAAVPVDRHSLAAMEAELDTLRALADQIPYLTWKEAPGGETVWANRAYLTVAARLHPEASSLAWPPPRVFPDHAEAGRCEVAFPGGRSGWFEVAGVPMPDGTMLRHALPIDAIVAAEQRGSDFVQTLTRTFASLTVGLAVFDRNRRLGLFNPALADLTGLPPGFMIPRPSLQAFVDRLRDLRILPEPKNFETWRQRLASLEAAAVAGTFEETWTLADGRVFQVSGRPYPDGAIAFLFADVSAEMRLTRQFRSELQMNQAVLDTLDEAIAVFAADGALTLANAAYSRMWSLDTRKATDSPTLASALAIWRVDSPTASEWAALSEAAAAGELRRPTGFTVERLTGRRLDCRFLPLPGGALMAGFTEVVAPSPSLFRRKARGAQRIA
jgi:PAS domain-containing protein